MAQKQPGGTDRVTVISGENVAAVGPSFECKT